MSEVLGPGEVPGLDGAGVDALSAAAVTTVAELAAADAFALAERAGLDVDRVVAWVAWARAGAPVSMPESGEEGAAGPVRSVRQTRGLRIAHRIETVRIALKEARRRIRDEDGSRRAARALKRARRRLRALGRELGEQGVGRRRAEVLDTVLDDLDDAVTRFLDGPPRHRRCRALRRRVRDALRPME